MTPQQRMADKLAQAGIPAKEIKCYGSQIMIVAWSFDAANRWVSLLQRIVGVGGPVRGPVQSYEHNKKNENTVLLPSCHQVWLVSATIR